jgi:hypothetical protein
MCTGFNTWDGQLSPVVTSFGTTVNWVSTVSFELKMICKVAMEYGICKKLKI